ncbi:hypothetical protein, partial [Kocuria rosea]|uniref:hypothetical protein n=1 Tax=Kocuria rosea TaxID=1275 RepID=UPI0020409295|nr:hypothetical protein [Kocuria rosea]
MTTTALRASSPAWGPPACRALRALTPPWAFGLGGGGDDDLVGVGDHVRPVLAPGGVAAVHDDEPVVLLGDPVQGVHLGPGDFVGVGRRFVGAQDVVGILGVVVDEGGQLG